MAEYSIEIGATDGFRYIGIEPPLNNVLIEQIFSVLGSEIEMEAVGNGRALSKNTPYKGPAHSEIALTQRQADFSEERVRDIVSKIRVTLERDGHTVMTDPEIKLIGFGRHLFGGEDRYLG